MFGSNKVGSAEIELRATTKKLQGDIDSAKNKIEKSVKDIEKSFDGVTSSVKSSTIAIGTFSGLAANDVVRALTNIAKSSIETAKRFELINNRLSRLTKSGQDFADTQDYIREASNRLNVDVEQYSDTVARLLALEKSGVIQNRERTKQLSEGIVEAAAAYGASGGQIENVLYGMSQALGQGTVQMQELNQVVEPMPGFLGDLASAAGMSAGEFRKLVGEGKVTSEMFSDILVKAFEKSAGAASGMTDTITGSSIRLKNEWKLLQLTIAEGFATDGYEGFLNLLTKTLSVMNDVIQGARMIAAEISKISGIDLQSNAVELQKQKVNRLSKKGAGSLARTDIFGNDILVKEQIKLYDLQAKQMKSLEAQYRTMKGFDVKTGAPIGTPIKTTETITGGNSSSGGQSLNSPFQSIKTGTREAKTEVEALNESLKQTDDLVAKDITGAFDTMFESIILGTGDAKDAVRQLGNEILKTLYQQTVGQQMGGLSSAIGGIFSNAIGSVFGGSASKISASGVPIPVSKPIPSFDVGTPYVQNDMLAQIHKGEAVLTPHQADLWRSGNSGGATYNIDARGAAPGVEAKIRNVLNDVTNLRAAVPSMAVGAIKDANMRGVNTGS